MFQAYPRRPSFGRALTFLLGSMLAGCLTIMLLCAGTGFLLLWGAERLVAGVQQRIAASIRESEINAVRAAAVHFIQDVQSGNVGRAYEQASHSFRARQTLTAWQTLVHEQNQLRTVSGIEVERQRDAEAQTRTYQAILTSGDGDAVVGVISMIEEAGCWRVDRVVFR